MSCPLRLITHPFNAVPTLMYDSVMVGTNAYGIFCACRAAISPMLNMVNLQVTGLCAARELAILIAVLDGTCHGRGPQA